MDLYFIFAIFECNCQIFFLFLYRTFFSPYYYKKRIFWIFSLKFICFVCSVQSDKHVVVDHIRARETFWQARPWLRLARSGIANWSGMTTVESKSIYNRRHSSDSPRRRDIWESEEPQIHFALVIGRDTWQYSIRMRQYCTCPGLSKHCSESTSKTKEPAARNTDSERRRKCHVSKWLCESQDLRGSCRWG